ncbi:unnamed protein product, partial [marine sediment metagenome]
LVLREANNREDAGFRIGDCWQVGLGSAFNIIKLLKVDSLLPGLVELK